MLRLITVSNEPLNCHDSITLSYEDRTKARRRVFLDSGQEAGLFLVRGTQLRDGDCLLTEDGVAVRVKAAHEPVSVVFTDDPLLFGRICYHLGNRHIALQILPGEVRFLTDHVIEQLVQSLGLGVCRAQLPFQPEIGAYAGAQRHEHSH